VVCDGGRGLGHVNLPFKLLASLSKTLTQRVLQAGLPHSDEHGLISVVYLPYVDGRAANKVLQYIKGNPLQVDIEQGYQSADKKLLMVDVATIASAFDLPNLVRDVMTILRHIVLDREEA